MQTAPGDSRSKEWLFGILDFRQALWVVVAIAGIAAAPTIVAAIWTT